MERNEIVNGKEYKIVERKKKRVYERTIPEIVGQRHVNMAQVQCGRWKTPSEMAIHNDRIRDREHNLG